MEGLSYVSNYNHPSKYKFNGISYETSNDLYNLVAPFRSYDPSIAKWNQLDPMNQFENGYFAFGGNPVSMSDPLGLKSNYVTPGRDAYDADAPSGTKRDLFNWRGRGGGGFTDANNKNHSFNELIAENIRTNNVDDLPDEVKDILGKEGIKEDQITSGKVKIYAWYREYYKGNTVTTVSDGYQIIVNGNRSFWAENNEFTESNEIGCNDCVNMSTIGKNIFGLSYAGGNNPKTKKGDDSFSYIPKRRSDFPAIGHDRRYDRLGIKGASGLFADKRAIGADWRFVAEEMTNLTNPFLNPIDRITAGYLGVLLGLAALPKTVDQLNSPFGLIQIMMWDNYSNYGVNNTPDFHRH